MGLNEASVKSKRLFGQLATPRACCFRDSKLVHEVSGSVKFRQARIRWRVRGLPGDRGLVVLLRFQTSSRSGGVCAGKKKGFVRFRVDATRASESGLLLRCEPDSGPGGDVSGPLRLHRQHITRIEFVAFRQELSLWCRLKELCRNPHPVAGPHDRSFDECIELQLARDLRQLLRSLPVMTHRLE